MSSSDQPQHDASTRPPPGLSAIELLLWRHHNETTDPDPEPAQPYDIDKDFRRAPPVHREAHVILPEWSEIDHDSIFGIHLRASAEKPAEEKALANKRKAARDQRKADKAAASGETVEPKAKKPKKPRTAEQTLDDEKHRARVLTENAMADDFLEHGFTHVHNRDGQVCGEDVADFSEILEIMDENGEVKEVFLRSETHDMFKQFVAYLPKAYKLKCGRDKGYVKTFSRKVLSAMQSYVTMGTNGMYTCIVKELDTDWKGVEQIRRRLAKLLPPEMMPHFVVARWINGQLSRPHLIWMLRSPVYWNPPRTVTYKTGRTAQFGDPTHVEGSKAHKAKKLLDRVNLGLTKLLLECGADPAQTNCAKMKNPLSPHMSVGVLNGDNLTDLRAFRSIKGFDMAAKFSDLNADAEALNNVRPLVSQPLFHATVLQTTFELNKAKAGKDVDYVIACRDKSDLEQWIYDKVFPTIFQEWGNFRSVERMVRSRAKRFATTHKPGALVPKPGKADVARGRYRHLAPENMTAENAAGVELTRQAREAIEKTMKAFGGRIVAKQRHAKTMWEVGKFLVAWRNAGMPMEKTAVIKRLADENILGKSASYARWDEIAAIVAGDSATLHTCKKAADSSFRSSSRKSYHGPHQDSEAPASGDPANNQSDPGADRPSEPPHQTDDRTSASDGREEHAPQRRGFRIVEGSNVGENPAQHQPIFIVVRNAAEFDYAHAA